MAAAGKTDQGRIGDVALILRAANGAPRPRTGRNICEVCERALARTDTGMCDFCTAK